MRVVDVLLGPDRHKAIRVFRQFVRDTQHHSASPDYGERIEGGGVLNPRREV
jgi:hypothetical protein